MTTNVFDGMNGVVSADTRWSTLSNSKWMIYIDEPNYPKLICKNIAGVNYAFLFAGDGDAIQKWKEWLKGDQNSVRPSANSMAICAVNLTTNMVELHASQEFLRQLPSGKIISITGTGTLYAASCWLSNYCAKKAISSASMHDIHTGSYVQFYEINTKQHNLPEQNDMTIDDVRNAMATRGYVMNKEIGRESSISISTVDNIDSISANDVAEIKQLRDSLIQAHISPTAPCIAVYETRSESQENELDLVLSAIFNKKITHN